MNQADFLSCPRACVGVLLRLDDLVHKGDGMSVPLARRPYHAATMPPCHGTSGSPADCAQFENVS